MPRIATSLLVALTALGARGWQWRMVSSAPFDRSVANFSSCGASPPPAADSSADRTYPASPPPLSPKPPTPPPPTASSGGDLVVGSQTIATDDAELTPSLRGGRRGADGCHATFTWIEEQRWTDGLRARLDIGGDGIIEGYLLQLVFAPEVAARLRVKKLVAGAVVSAEFAPETLVQPRLASGLGTMMFTLALGGDGGRAGRVRAPQLACVRAPAHMLAAQHAAADGDAWLATAHSDFLWMAEEFNRQYIVSHGKPHPEYAPSAADEPLQMHYLNGRLWCFMGAVSNATRSLEEATKINPHHVYSHLLLAKIRIGQGLHEKALKPLDEAARIQPSHWQTHLMRLHCLRALGRLEEPSAIMSHEWVCRNLKEACYDAGRPQAYPYLCDMRGRGGTARVRLLDDGTAYGGAELPAPPEAPSEAVGTKPKKPKRGGGKGGASAALVAADNEPTPEPAGRSLYGTHLHSAAARRKLHDDRYVVLRNLLPEALIQLLKGWYLHLDKTVEKNAVFQEKTQRHEYLPEVLSTYLNLALVPFASSMSSTVVAPTYPFPITYIRGGSIHPHLDVSDNELSLTFQVHLRDDRAGDGWPLTFLDPRGQELSNLNASYAKEVTLSDNDGVLYYGPDIVHWREPLDATLTQIVFAFREEDVAHCNNQ